MKNIYESPFKEKKKISFDLDKTSLDLMDSLANLTKSTRTIIFEALIYKGVPVLMQDMKTTWKALLVKGNLEREKKIKIEKLLNDLEKLEKDWNDKLLKSQNKLIDW